MMLKMFKNMCKTEFKEYGFKCYQNNYYRIINDIFQSFCLHRSVSGNECTVEFFIAPMCCDTVIDKKRCGPMHLKRFEGDNSWFAYDRHSEDSMNECIREICEYMHKYLMPFFEEGRTCKDAYDVIIAFEKVSNAKPSEIDPEFTIFAWEKAFLSLKNGEYDLSVKYFKACEKQRMYALERNLAVRGNELGTDYIERINHDLASLREKIKRISERDLKYIEQWISENEARSFSNFKGSKK